jgi:protein-S-isoprenylcysteine O-methyltransferase Ste14
MSAELPFRIAIAALIALLFPVGAYHRWKAKTGEPLRRQDEGLFVLVVLRLSGLVGILGIVAYLIDPRNLGWSQVELPPWVRWMGLPLGLLAVAWAFWMFHALGSNLTDTVNVRKHATLVTNGPYRWVRHPLYLAAILIVVSFSLLTASAFFAMIGGLAIALLIVRSGTEEAKLEERFGADYREYRSRTGFLLPRLRSAR